jgi:hypothetical protein
MGTGKNLLRVIWFPGFIFPPPPPSHLEPITMNGLDITVNMADLKYLSSDHYIGIVLKVHSSVMLQFSHTVYLCVEIVCVLEIVQNKSSSVIFSLMIC